MDTKAMLEWVNAVCTEARAAANKGDVSKANALGKSPAMRDFFNNVVMLRSIEAGQFVQWYPDKVQELNTLYEAYQRESAQTAQLTAQADRLATLEQKFDTMMTLLQTLTENQPDSAPAPEPEQPKKRRASKTQDADTEDAEEPEAPAETNADEDREEAD